MKTQDNIIEKIKKLLALAGNNPNEAEASLAAEKAQELMLKYGIDSQKLSVNLGAPEVKVGEKVVEKNLKLVVWKAQLLAAIARGSFCEVYCSKGWVFLVGKEHNREGVELVYKYLVDAIDRLVQTDVLSGAPAFAGVTPREYGWNFRRGCVARISSRFEELRRKQEREGLDAQTTAIVVADAFKVEKAAIRAYYDERKLKLGKGRSTSARYGGGYAEGAKAGSSISLSPQAPLSKGSKALA